MENIASPTPGIDSMAHWPGWCSKHLPPSAPFHAEGLDIRRIHANGRDHAQHRDQVVRHFSFTPSALMTLTMFMMLRTLLHAAAAADAGIDALVVGRDSRLACA